MAKKPRTASLKKTATLASTGASSRARGNLILDSKYGNVSPVSVDHARHLADVRAHVAATLTANADQPQKAKTASPPRAKPGGMSLSDMRAYVREHGLVVKGDSKLEHANAIARHKHPINPIDRFAGNEVRLTEVDKLMGRGVTVEKVTRAGKTAAPKGKRGAVMAVAPDSAAVHQTVKTSLATEKASAAKAMANLSVPMEAKPAAKAPRQHPAWGGTDRLYASKADAAVVGRAISHAHIARRGSDGLKTPMPSGLESPDKARAYLKANGQPHTMAAIVRANQASKSEAPSWASSMSPPSSKTPGEPAASAAPAAKPTTPPTSSYPKTGPATVRAVPDAPKVSSYQKSLEAGPRTVSYARDASGQIAPGYTSRSKGQLIEDAVKKGIGTRKELRDIPIQAIARKLGHRGMAGLAIAAGSAVAMGLMARSGGAQAAQPKPAGRDRTKPYTAHTAKGDRVYAQGRKVTPRNP